MSTRRERELRLTADQAAYVGKALNASVRRVVTLFATHGSTKYEGHEHDQAIVRQVLDGIKYEMQRDLDDTLSRIIRRYIP